MGSIVSRLPHFFNNWTEEQLYHYIGKPIIETIERRDSQLTGPEAPLYAVQPASFSRLHFDNFMRKIKICGFEHSFFQQDNETHLHGPWGLRAPESYFKEALQPKADIWSFGCIVE